MIAAAGALALAAAPPAEASVTLGPCTITAGQPVDATGVERAVCTTQGNDVVSQN